MYILLCGALPFLGNNKGELYAHILKGSFDFSSVYWKSVSSTAKDLITKMLVKEPHERISAEDALMHPWFKFTQNNEVPVNPKIYESLKHFRVSSRFQKEALGYIVNELDYDQIKDLREAFNTLDTHKNGFITLTDFVATLSSPIDTKSKIEEVFFNLDYNKDGRINYSEFLAATLAYKNIIDEESLWAAFRHFDPSNTGKITAKSLRNALKRTGKKNFNATELISEVDYDKDGGINFEEFRKIVKGINL